VNDRASIQIVHVASEARGRRLDQWLAAKLPDVSRVRVQQLIRQRKIRVNGETPKPSLRLRGGEQIVVSGPVELPAIKATAEDIPLDVVYEDADIAVINKPAGMSVHAGSGKGRAGSQGTLVNALLHRFRSLSQTGGEMRPGIVHRLDKETSGLLVVAKTDRAHRELARQFSERKVKKTYIALVHGWMRQPHGTVNAPISRDPVRRARMTTRPRQASTSGGKPGTKAPGKAGRTAITYWKLLQQIEGRHGKFSLLEIKIETGRTHQIRVHMASIGHPVAGDTLYGAPRKVASYRSTKVASYRSTMESASLERNFLHSSTLQFEHPINKTPLEFRQTLPEDLKAFFRRIEES
jgi:23S rRNA pseudouridine1911/1915/1917 synthase